MSDTFMESNILYNKSIIRKVVGATTNTRMILIQLQSMILIKQQLFKTKNISLLHKVQLLAKSVKLWLRLKLDVRHDYKNYDIKMKI